MNNHNTGSYIAYTRKYQYYNKFWITDFALILTPSKQQYNLNLF